MAAGRRREDRKQPPFTPRTALGTDDVVLRTGVPNEGLVTAGTFVATIFVDGHLPRLPENALTARRLTSTIIFGTAGTGLGSGAAGRERRDELRHVFGAAFGTTYLPVVAREYQYFERFPAFVT
jgi:hypothetical protein